MLPRMPTNRLLRALLLAALALAATAVPAAAKSHTLSPGSKGAAVKALQTYLARDGYLPWSAVNGRYDYRTTQAVMAFQGWSRMLRTGIASRRVLSAIQKADRPVPSSRWHGARIEVHVDRQVLLLVNAGNQVVRAIHVSTGAGGKTPLGDFHVLSKALMSWSNPFHVWLPWASYFHGGFALHSYPDVPGYPASHGCIRMPAPEAPVVYRFDRVGMPVHVH
jgi:lipoprotein-anchoring transpeptidase ErfK/SrfK